MLFTLAVGNKDARLVVCRPEVGGMTGAFTSSLRVWLLHEQQRNRDLSYKSDTRW